MFRFKPRTIYLTAGLGVIAIIGWFAYSIFAMPAIPSHVGDGQFQNRSWRFPWKSVGIPITGYTIKFTPFELSQTHEVSYSVERLPEIGKDAGIYLCIHDPNRKLRTDKSRGELNAAIEIEVVDGNGRSVCHMKQPLAKMIWADPEGGRDTYGLYRLEESFFVPSRKETYRIQVRYSPDPKLEDFEGFVYVRCGGSI